MMAGTRRMANRDMRLELSAARRYARLIAACIILLAIPCSAQGSGYASLEAPAIAQAASDSTGGREDASPADDETRPSTPPPADTAGARSAEDDGWLERLGKTAAGILGRIVLYLVLLAALVLIPLGMGGTFVMVGAAALFGLVTGFEHVTLRLLAVLLGLALVGEGVESLLGVAMARRYGASKWGMWGAFIGGIGGAIIGAPVPVVGNLVGALIGVFAGAFLLEWLGRGRSDSSLRAGWGALIGRTAASAIKLGLGMVILILIVSRTLR